MHDATATARLSVMDNLEIHEYSATPPGDDASEKGADG